MCIYFISLFIPAKGTPSYKYYEEAEEKATTYMRNLSIFMYVDYAVSSFILSISNGLYNTMVMENYDPSTWYLPLRVSLPFDQSTYIGYVLALLTQIIIGLMYLVTMCTVVCYFVSCCYYIEAFLLHLKSDIMSIDSRIKEMNVINQKEMNRMYRDVVLFHIKIFE